MQSSCAHHVPHYTTILSRRFAPAASVQSSYLTLSFRVASYCRRVDLECDKQGIGGGSKRFDDNDAQPDA